MAQVEAVELAVEEAPNSAAVGAKSSKLKLLLVAVAAVVLAVSATLGALYFLGVFPPKSAPATADQAPAQAVAEPLKKAIYVDLDPRFTVNFQGRDGARYLQIALTAMTRDPDVEKQIKQNLPIIRNDLNLLFSEQDSATLSTKEGKEALRAAALKAVQDILERETGNPGVEAIYFTNFVMQ